ncbi:MAG: hypothetical protein COB36_10685 [Alphaproteobacteria bacterium]|nr:MAG: hypothetical protein COB36_10685 [Alphaproteobacteria bacterium]
MTNTVRTPDERHNRMLPDIELANALLGGSVSMRKAQEDYLPKNEAETDEKYSSRLKRSFLYNVFENTTDTMAGKPFSKDVTVQNVPDSMMANLENIDRQGRDLTSFACDLLHQALSKGLTFILVEFPQAPAEGERSRQQEIDMGLSPYWVHIKPESMLGIDYDYYNGALVVHSLRILETYESRGASFDRKTEEQVRVIYPDRFEVWRKAEAEWVMFEEGLRSVNKITLVPVYAKQVGPFAAKNLLKPLMEKNLEHWQSSSEQRNILHVARVPLLFGRGLRTIDDEGNPIKLTSDSIITSDSSDGDLKYVEHSGRAISSGEKDLETLENQMEALGAILLQADETRTATAQRSTDFKGNSKLHTVVGNLKSALEQALAFSGDWINVKIDAEVTIFTEFSLINPDFMTADDLLKAKMAGLISHKLYIEIMQRRGVFSSDIPSEDIVEEALEDIPSIEGIDDSIDDDETDGETDGSE